ncbi:MAG: hypothetical protein QOE45_1529 [Frankiaceae bacterium]|jgi:DNA-binding beta-propeller fold protein YncE|nr:hypothetical protein [Frankiaceae bacterium]
MRDRVARAVTVAAAVLATCGVPARAATMAGAARDSHDRVATVLACSRPAAARPAGLPADRAACLGVALGGTQSPASPGGAALPVCANQAAGLNDRCERWARAFNDRSPDGSKVDDTPAGLVLNKQGDRMFVATTTKVGAAQPRVTVAALSTKNGATLWTAHPPVVYSTTANAVTVTADDRTLVVTGTLLYLPNLNASPLTYWFTTAYATANGRFLWGALFRGGGVNVPVAVRTSPRGDSVFVTGTASYGGHQREYIEWVTAGYRLRDGKELWHNRYGGQAGGQNWPVGLAVAPHGDVVYVAGSSEHPQTTGTYNWDYGALALDARTGRVRWKAVVRQGSNHDPVAMALSPAGDRLYVTGAATYGTVTSPAYGMLTVALSTRNGARSWLTRYLDPSGLSATPMAFAASPKGDRVFLAAAVGQRRTVVAGAVEPSVLTITTFGLDARSGHGAWSLAYAPDPSYSAVPTALAVNAQGTMLYLAGQVGPPLLVAAYPVTLAVTAAGKRAWVARYDVRDPGGAGVGAAGYPAVPVAVVVDRAGANVYDSLSYYPAGTGVASTECGTAHGAGVQQTCAPTGAANLVLAYAK